MQGTVAGDVMNPHLDWRFIVPFIPWGTLYAHPDNSGRSALTGDELEEYTAMRDHLLDLLTKPNSDCAKYLKTSVGVDPSEVAETVRAQRAFNGNTSTLSTGRAGLLPPGDHYVEGAWVSARDSVRSLFRNPRINAAQAGYPRRGTGATRNDVYYAPGRYTETTILHEALHTFLRGNDDVLKKRNADSFILDTYGCNSLGHVR
jgi:hypothetical protein